MKYVDMFLLTVLIDYFIFGPNIQLEMQFKRCIFVPVLNS